MWLVGEVQEAADRDPDGWGPAAAVTVMPVTAGDRSVCAIPRARSRGKKPLLQAGQ